MKSLFLAAALALSAFSASAATPEVIDASKAVVQLERDCSGTVVKSERDFKTGDVETYILTAKHCIQGGDKLTVNVDNYQKNRVVKTEAYVADVWKKSWKSDLALLKLRDKQTGFLFKNEVAPKDTKMEWGDDVLTIGYPLGRSKTLTYGTLGYVEDVTGEADFSQSNEFYRATPSVAPGSSGSGLLKLVDGKYKIVGILTAAAGRSSTHIALYTPIEEVNEFMESAFSNSVTVKTSQ